MSISTFTLVLGGLVLTALLVSTIAQASPPPDNSNRLQYLPPAMRVATTPPPRRVPTIGFNPDYRPKFKDQTPK